MMLRAVRRSRSPPSTRRVQASRLAAASAASAVASSCVSTVWFSPQAALLRISLIIDVGEARSVDATS